MSEPGTRSSRLRVLILIDRLTRMGGAERFARELALRLDEERFERTVCVTRWSDEEVSSPDRASSFGALRQAGVEVLGLGRSSTLELRAWHPLLRLLRERPIDILHAHMFGSNLWGSVLGSIARTPVLVAHEQTWSYQGQPLRRLLDGKLIGRLIDAFICVSREDRRRMIEVEGVDPAKIVLVPNAIPTPATRRAQGLRKELEIPEGDPVIGTVCVLRPQKALDVLVRAGALLRDPFPRLRILIVGDGPERQSLEALVCESGLDRMVSFLGPRGDVPELLSTFDVAVSSSEFEGTPLAVMEYMAAGLPIVATRVGGVPELIEDRVHGLLVEPRDPERLADSIAELLRDRVAAAEMGRRAQERQRREFDIDVAVRRVERLYEELYAASPRADPTRVGAAG